MNHSRSDLLTPARLIVASLGLALVWLVLGFVFGSDSARADDRDSLLGGVVSSVIDTVDVVEAPVADVAPAVTPVTDAVSAPVRTVTAVVPATQPVIDAVVAPKPVSRIASPAAETVDEVVAALPVVDQLPIVSDVLGDSPISDATTPVTGIVDDVLSDVVETTTDTVPALPGQLPDLGSVPAVGGLATVMTASVTAATVTTASVTAAATTMSWAANLNFRADASPAASARSTHPDPVPRGPADDGTSAPPSPSGASAGAASPGPVGSASAADTTSSSLRALISGAALSHTENDALPSSLARDLSSTPD